VADLRDVWLALSTERVNTELMFVDDEEIGFLVTCRMRPWKGSAQEGRMILAGGRTPHEALAYAYQGLFEDRWLSLDWRARASKVGVMVALVPRITSEFPRRGSVLDVDSLFGDEMVQSTLPEVNEPQNGLQPVSVGSSTNKRGQAK